MLDRLTRIDRRQNPGAAFDFFRRVQAQVLAEGAGNELHAQRDIIANARRYHDAGQPENSGSEHGSDCIEDALHCGAIFLLEPQFESRHSPGD